MVAVRRFGRRRLIVRLSHGAFACACAIILAGCDLLLTMLPQGGANAAFAYADPRLEKSVRIKGLNEVFNIAVAPDGRVFAIARDGVAEYTADLKHVRTYYADAAEGIQRREFDRGPEEWQVTSGPGDVRVVYGTRQGLVLYLFPAGATIFQRKLFDSILYSSLGVSVLVESSSPFIYQEITIAGISPLIRVLGFRKEIPAVYAIREMDTEQVGAGRTRYALDFGQLTPTNVPALFTFEQTLVIPSVMDSFSAQRLYISSDHITLVMGQDSYIGDVRSSTFIYDRASGGEPIARFDLRGAITAASDTALYAITSDHDESGGWIHKLRFKP